MLPVALSAVDLFARSGMGWLGVLLNLTNTRMLYTLIRAGISPAGAAAAIAQSGSNIKLFEAVFESMPQLFIQMIVFFGGLLNDEPAIVYASLALSVVSTAQVCACGVHTAPSPARADRTFA